MWRTITARLDAQNAPSRTSKPNAGRRASPRRPSRWPTAGRRSRRGTARDPRAYSRVEPDAEQQPERVRPVVERREVVRLHRPHVRVAVARVEPVAVRTPPARRASSSFSSATDSAVRRRRRHSSRLEQEPAVDVDDDLRRADEVRVEQRQPLGVVGRRARPSSRRAASRRRSTRSRRAPSAVRRCIGVRSASATLWNA